MKPLIQRNIGLDILRILLAMMVIAIHFNAPATGHVAKSVSGEMKLFVYPIMALCYPAVNTYVLISGYFSYSYRKNMEDILNSLIRLWLCLLFFSLLGFFISVGCGFSSFSFISLASRFLPLTRGVWWYMTVYFVLMLISPALNTVMDNLSKKTYVNMLFVGLMICSIIPFFLKFESTIGLNNGSGLIWFVILYMTGAGLSKYCSKEKSRKKKKYGILLYFALTFYLLISHYIHNFIGLEGYTLEMYNSIIVYGQAVSLFVMFYNIDIQSLRVSKSISFFAGLSLAAYIFHCQEDIGRMLWQITTPWKYANSPYIILLFFYIVFGVFFVAIAIEYLRKKISIFCNVEKKLTSSLVHVCTKTVGKISFYFEKLFI